jgi:hypothetical protein
MPIEIRELHIKAIVDAGTDKKLPGMDESPPKENPEQHEANLEGMVDTCVQKILDILKDKMER